MRESAIAQLLQNCDLTEVRLEITGPDGVKKVIPLKDPEDFMNDVVKQGTIVNLVFSNGTIYSGIFDSIVDEDGVFVIYLCPKSDVSYGIGLTYDKLLGYYTDDV